MVNSMVLVDNMVSILPFRGLFNMGKGGKVNLKIQVSNTMGIFQMISSMEEEPSFLIQGSGMTACSVRGKCMDRVSFCFLPIRYSKDIWNMESARRVNINGSSSLRLTMMLNSRCRFMVRTTGQPVTQIVRCLPTE
jgi:hypothetical protein